MNRNITHLREHLFDVIEGVKAGTMPTDKAKAIATVAQTMVNSVKAEVDFVRATKRQSGSGFLMLDAPEERPGE